MYCRGPTGAGSGNSDGASYSKRLGIACAVISTPAHVQDYPARYSPQMGFEGANVIFDTWVHPLMMGLEEHLLTMFRDDFEFNEESAPSHLASEGGGGKKDSVSAEVNPDSAQNNSLTWELSAEKELRKIPFFVRERLDETQNNLPLRKV